MSRNLTAGIAVVVVAAVVAGILAALALRTNTAASNTVSATAEAALVSVSGETMGTVVFREEPDGVLVAADLHGLTPGGHAIAVHAMGACTPDFSAAGDHFHAAEKRWTLVHRNWKPKDQHGEHGGDLPNIYAHSDGSARADFITNGFTLANEKDHSLFDDDGSAVVVHERPHVYGAPEDDAGSRIACGVIRRN